MSPEILFKVQLPTEEESRRYFADYKVPGNIKAHCLRVRQVSRYLAEELQKKLPPGGVELNVLFTDRLGLFHDLFKAVVLKEMKPNKFHQYEFTEEEKEMWEQLRKKYPGMYEGDVAYLVFNENYPELAVSLKKVSNPYETNLSWEEKIVHYADWRVFQDKIVSMDERVEYLQERYPRNDDGWEKFIAKMKKIEKMLFAKLSFSPDELAGKVRDVSN